jgi:hypothetical protein
MAEQYLVTVTEDAILVDVTDINITITEALPVVVASSAQEVINGAGVPSGALGTVGQYYIQDGVGDVYKKTGASTWTLLAVGSGSDVQMIPWSIEGNASVRTGNLGVRFPRGGEMLAVTADLGIAPAGAPLIFDVLKNGTSIFDTPPQFNAGVGGFQTFIPDITTFVSTDRFTTSILGVGTSTVGADLVVQLIATRGA